MPPQPTTIWQIYRRPLLLCLCWLLGLSLSRLVLVMVFGERVGATGGYAFIFLQGLRFDLILLGLTAGPPLLLWGWLHWLAPLRWLGRFLLPAWLALLSAALFFTEAASRSFINQFDSRPNHLFVDYLRYPQEVMATLAGAHLLELLLVGSFTLLLTGISFQWLRRDPAWQRRSTFLQCLLLTPLILLLMVAMIRSTLAHRPVNPSIAAFSQDAMVNQLPLNSPYSVLYSLYERRRDSLSETSRYGHMEDAEVQQRVLAAAGIEAGALNPALPSLHRQRPTRSFQQPLNILIVLEESIGAEYVGSLGGHDLTPGIDALADQGIWFERLYATGVRSARGIEAVITGFTPALQEPAVKHSDAQTNFFTLAALLQDHGYRTSFIYGGESHFDNMRRFFLNNGFQTVIDQGDFSEPDFMGPWGVSDEDLFQRAEQYLLEQGEGPFFSLVFTSSNHEPFDIPPGRVAAVAGEDGPLRTAIRYADYALDKFITSARSAPWWQDTVVLVVADHNVRTWGGNLVPVERFRVPGVILGGQIEPRRVPGIVSQVDLLPTLLSLAGVQATHPAVGRDLSLPRYREGVGRAFMQYHRLHAYMESDYIVVLQPDLPPVTRLKGPGEELFEAPDADPELQRTALAHALWAPLMLRLDAYRHR